MFVRACVIASAVACFAVTNASAQQQRTREWVQLGCYDIRGNPQEAGTIRVDIENTRFSAIRLGAVGSNVLMLEAKVTYPNGNSDYLAVESVRIAASGQSAPIDLEGTSHQLREIELIFKSTAAAPGRRRICAEGQVAARRPSDPVRNWVEIGCHTVDFSRDVDRFRVTNQSDRFEALRLNVRENDVQIMSFNVTYFGGGSEKLAVNPPVILKDRRSRRIPLKQGPQRIRDIELLYYSIPNVGGRAMVCVQGLIMPDPPPPPPPPDLSQLPDPDVGWERFGCHTVDETGESTKIYVGRDRGRYSGIQVQAFQNNVRVDRLDANLTDRRGDPVRKHRESFRVRRDTGVPLLFDDTSYRIDSIDLSYRVSEFSGGRAIVCLNGRKAENSSTDDQDIPRPQVNWRLLGCQSVRSNRETDVYLVGRAEGRYRAIRFHARNNDVYLRAITVMFEDGSYERILMSGNLILSGTRTSEFNLGSTPRIIDRILLSYEASRDYPGTAELCIEGLLGRARPSDRSPL